MKLEELGLSFMAASLESYLADQSRNENTLIERLTDLVDLEYIPRKERDAAQDIGYASIQAAFRF